MVALTWLRGSSPTAAAACSSTALGVAVGVALLASIGTFLVRDDVADDHACRSSACRSTGRSRPSPAPRPARCSRRSAGIRGVSARAAGAASRPTDGPAAADRRLDAAHRTGPRRRPADGLRAAFPRRAARARRRAAPACCSPSRRPPTCTPRPATRSPSAAGRRPTRVSRSTESSTCRRPTRCSSRSARPSAPSRRRRRTTSCCCRRRTLRARGRSRRRASSSTQIHARLSPRAARQPERRLHRRSRRGRGTSRRGCAGGGLVGDNLGTALDQARQDALYAQLLFLFLGLPGAILAGLITASIAVGGRRTAAGATARCCARAARRRAQLVRVALAETALAGARAWSARARPARCSSAAAPSAPPASAPARSPRCCGRAAPRLAGLGIAAASIALPAWRDARSLTVAGQRRQVGREGRAPWWARYGLDVAALRWAASCSGRRRAAATTSCSPPRACRRSRSTGTRCWPRCWAGSAPGCWPTASPTSCSRAAGRRWRGCCARSPASSRRPSPRRWAASAGCWPRAVTLVALTRGLRRLDRGLQRHLPAAGRGRRAADQRRRRHRHRVARRERRARRAAARLAAGRRRAQRRAAAAPLRLRRRRPAGPLRRPPGRRSAPPASCRTPGSQGGTADALMARLGARGRTAVLVSAETVKDFQLRPGDLAPAAPPGRAHQAVHDGALPLRRRGQGVPDRADGLLPRRQRELRRAGHRQRRRRLVPGRRPTGRAPRPSPSACARARRHRAPGHRHRRLAQGRRLEPHRGRARRA